MSIRFVGRSPLDGSARLSAGEPVPTRHHICGRLSCRTRGGSEAQKQESDLVLGMPLRETRVYSKTALYRIPLVNPEKVGNAQDKI